MVGHLTGEGPHGTDQHHARRDALGHRRGQLGGDDQGGGSGRDPEQHHRAGVPFLAHGQDAEQGAREQDAEGDRGQGERGRPVDVGGVGGRLHHGDGTPVELPISPHLDGTGEPVAIVLRHVGVDVGERLLDVPDQHTARDRGFADDLDVSHGSDDLGRLDREVALPAGVGLGGQHAGELALVGAGVDGGR